MGWKETGNPRSPCMCQVRESENWKANVLRPSQGHSPHSVAPITDTTTRQHPTPTAPHTGVSPQDTHGTRVPSSLGRACVSAKASKQPHAQAGERPECSKENLPDLSSDNRALVRLAPQNKLMDVVDTDLLDQAR